MKKSIIVLCALLVTAAPLLAEVVKLDPIVVTASRTAQSISEVPASITIITQKDIVNSGSTTLAEVLQHEVGVQIVNNGSLGSVASLSIRGSEAAQVLLLIDGIRMNSAQNGQFDLSQLPIVLEQIERIEILRGPASNVYGANALGGVVQIITKKASDSPLTTLSWKQSRWDTRQLSLTAAQTISNVSFRLGLSDAESYGYRENSELDQQSIDAAVKIALPYKFSLDFSTFHLNKETGVPGKTSLPSPYANQEVRDSLYNLTLKGPLGNSELQARGTYQRNHLHYVNPNNSEDDTHLIKTRTLELQDTLSLGWSDILIGGEARNYQLESTANGRHEQDDFALFGEINAQLTEKIKAALGMRYDKPSDYSSQVSPRAALLYRLNDKTKLRATVGISYRAPSLNDLYWPDTGWTAGNPYLDPETAIEYEIGADHNFNNSDSLSFALFLREVEDLIDWAPDAGGKWTPSNVTDAQIYGAEIKGNWAATDFITLAGNYTYLHAVNKTTDEFVNTKPRHQLHGSIDLGLWEKTFLRLQGQYLKYYEKPDRDTNMYAVFDATLKRSFATSNFDLEGSLGIKNIFDREYEVNEGYPMPGRALFVSLTALF